MFSEILKIIPKLDTQALNAMEKSLSSRFTRVAKKFGGGLMSLFKGGGWIGAAVALIDKLLNPLKEVQAAIDQSLAKGDDLSTYAQQFNTTAGKLAKLQAFAGATGLDQEGLRMLISKFQVAVAEAQADPSKETSVRQFANRTDTADAFFEFIQSLQKMDKNSGLLVQTEVFGEKQILKASEFLSANFEELAGKFKDFSSTRLTKAAEALGKNSDLNDLLAQRRGLSDLQGKAGVINENMIRARDKAERIALERENQRIRSYEDLAAINETANKIMLLVEEGIAMLGKLINFVTPTLNRIVEAIEKFTKGPMARGFMKFFGKGD